MSKKTIALIVSLVILTAALLFVALSTKQPTVESPTDTSSANRPQPTPSAQTTLTLSPNPLNSTTGTNEILVNIDSGSNEITTIQLELAYDPKLISNIKVDQGDFLTNEIELLNENDTATGRISYAIGILPSQTAKAGKGTVAKITFTPRNATLLTKETELTLLPKSLVTASGISESVLKEGKSTKIILPSGNSTTQPTTTKEPGVPVLSPETKSTPTP